MGKRGIEILGLDVNELLTELNKAFADEWLAHYMYWLGAKVAMGPMKGEVITELTEHAADELRHAEMLADRIVELGGIPVVEPKLWYEMTNCGYDAPSDPFVRKLVEQNIEAERCAIDVYDKLVKMVEGKDRKTFNILQEILEDEIEHEDDLEALIEDMDLLKKNQ
ncbi:ferritin [candidate division WOR-3 bacterium]|uniref:Ferritin n=1 Tax=candidate division WOR-3 bacterium TaxID=2052148 RepID=A0A9D5QC92_UNCW3|nr:ferritin [candidate division WOR-3 bacterium]MBD3364423.1 ferritin [candidate division WOR-3 bacterium]